MSSALSPCGRHLGRVAGLQPGVPRDVAGLLSERRRAADDEILDRVWREPGAAQQRLVDGPEQLVRVGAAEPAAVGVGPADRRAQRLDDQGLAAAGRERAGLHQITVPRRRAGPGR
jgi:hypothetical protein